MRLIDADALIERIKYSFYPDERVSIETVTGCFLDETGCSPTVDAEPVRHGHWVEMERGHYFKCSLCRNPIPYKFGWRLYNGVILNKRYYNYCPNCGAKMDEVSE